MNDISIIGAGLVGTLLSIHLAKLGFDVDVYDRCEDPRQSGMTRSSRSLMIVICTRGFLSLDEVGVGDLVRESSIPIYGRMIHSVDGNLSYQPYGNNRESLQAIDRSLLNEILINFATSIENITFHFGEKCIDVDCSKPLITFLNTDGNTHEVETSRVFGADGANSVIRQSLLKAQMCNYSQEFLPLAYKEIIFTPNRDSSSLSMEVFHVWPRETFMLSSFPKADGSFSLSLQLPIKGPLSFDKFTTESDFRCLFEDKFQDILPLVKNNLADYVTNPTGYLITVKCFPWTYRNNVALIGDACHAILPFHGQGANAGFEDCLVLIECIAKYSNDWDKIFSEYETLRKPNTDAIADLSYYNFEILQNKVGDPEFQLRKTIERKIQLLYPENTVASQYYAIAFTSTPYLDALENEKHFRQFIDEIAKVDNIASRINTPEAELIIAGTANRLKIIL